MQRKPDIVLAGPGELDAAVIALGAMVDAFLRMAFIEHEPSLAGTRYESDPAALAELLSKLWIRALFTGDPDDL